MDVFCREIQDGQKSVEICVMVWPDADENGASFSDYM